MAAGGWVTDQYQGAGLVFASQRTGVDSGFATAIARVNGTAVWTPAAYSDGFVLGAVSYVGLSSVTADLVKPGTATPDVADVVRVNFLSAGNLMVSLTAYDKNGAKVASTSALIAGGVETPLSLGGAGIESIRATAYQPIIEPSAAVRRRSRAAVITPGAFAPSRGPTPWRRAASSWRAWRHRPARICQQTAASRAATVRERSCCRRRNAGFAPLRSRLCSS